MSVLTSPLRLRDYPLGLLSTDPGFRTDEKDKAPVRSIFSPKGMQHIPSEVSAFTVYVKETAALSLYLSNLSFITYFKRVEHSEGFESAFWGRVGLRRRVMCRVKFSDRD